MSSAFLPTSNGHSEDHYRIRDLEESGHSAELWLPDKRHFSSIILATQHCYTVLRPKKAELQAIALFVDN